MYTVVIMQNNTTPAIYAFATYNEALAYYHTELAYRNESRTSTKAAILDPDLHMLRQETFTADTSANVEEEPSSQEG